MSKSDLPQRIHVVYGDDVHEAVPYLLERRSERTPWRNGRRADAEPHEPVAVVLNTEPRSIVTSLGWVGASGELGPRRVRRRRSPRADARRRAYRPRLRPGRRRHRDVAAGG